MWDEDILLIQFTILYCMRIPKVDKDTMNGEMGDFYYEKKCKCINIFLHFFLEYLIGYFSCLNPQDKIYHSHSSFFIVVDIS